MRILVVGASGRTGRLFVAQALVRGHSVTALVRKPRALKMSHERLRIVVGDVLESASLPAALAEQDAVVSLLAPRPRRDGNVYVEGTRNIVNAAAAAGVNRLVVVSAEGAGVQPDALPVAYRLILRIPVVARLYPDIARMERDLELRTDLDWTIVRAAVLTNGPRSGAYRAVLGDVVPRGLRISRADLAEFLLHLIERHEYIRQRVALAR